MNKKIVILLLVAFLFIGGTINLFADEEPTKEDTSDNYGLTELQLMNPSANPCGGSEGNGGGNPG